MPHIFPRRLLRRQDILNPKDMNDDLEPVNDVLSGQLDRTNFMVNNLKTNLRDSPSTTVIGETGPCVATGAYFNVYSDNVESQFPFHDSTSSDGTPVKFRTEPPNFVALDGETLRDSSRYTGSNPKAKPFVVPNNGEWSVVKNANLTANQQITFSTGRSKVWISAYAQYIWQGFYEYKPPWIATQFRKNSNVEVEGPDYGSTWAKEFGVDLPLYERAVLNAFGPSENWEYVVSPETDILHDNFESRSYEFSFPLNETSRFRERRRPYANGYHHISKGFLPCLIQFALRVDGKIVEESITGKHLAFEESAHGLKVTDSPPIEAVEEEDYPELTGLLGSFTELGTVFGQRSISTSSSYGDRGDARPGQKVRSARSVAYGPEVMPVRIGAVVDLQPGQHTIELVVRRLQRKKVAFGPGDFVGIFSRRLLAFDLPIKPPREEADFETHEIALDDGGSVPRLTSRNRPTAHYKSESLINESTLVGERKMMEGQVNSIGSSSLADNIFSNEYLPSKVQYSDTKTILSSNETHRFTGQFFGAPGGGIASSQAIYPGPADTRKTSRSGGWSAISDYAELADDFVSNIGWHTLGIEEAEELVISNTNLKLSPGEKLIINMDVELLCIEPIYSDAAKKIFADLNRIPPEKAPK